MLGSPNGRQWLHASARTSGCRLPAARWSIRSWPVSHFYRPVTPNGRPMSVEMTNLGPLGWITDAGGYRYESRHPITGAPWPSIPPLLLVSVVRGSPTQSWLAGRVPGQPLSPRRAHGPASGSRRSGLFRAGAFGLARRHGDLPRRGTRPRRSEPVACDFRRAMCVFWPERPGWPITESTASSPAPRGSFPGGGRLNLTLRRARPPPERTSTE